MTVPADRQASYWIDSTPTTDYPPLTPSVTVDVAVLGGGIAGLTTAVLLKRAGKTVAVVEADRIVQGVTGHTTAKVTVSHNLIYDELTSKFGRDGALLYADSQQAAMAQVAAFVDERGIDCQLEMRSNYVYTELADEVSKVEAEVTAARDLGLPASLVRNTPLPYDVAAAARFDNQLQFHPRRYLLALAEEIPGGGSHIFENTRATDVDEGEPRVVHTERGDLRATDVVVATHVPFLDRGLFFAKAAPYRDCVVTASIESSRAPDGMFISTGSEDGGTHSVRSAPYGDGRSLLIVTGGQAKAGQDPDVEASYAELADWVRGRFGVGELEYRWSTQDMSSVDRVPFVGPLRRGSEHLYVATGFSAWGMTNGTMSGILLRDLILGLDNPWAELYDPHRLDVRKSAVKFAKENLDVARRWVGDRLGATKGDPAALAAGEAAVVVAGGKRVAAYRDEGGALHAVSAVCTHLGCIVGWNNAERSWDCPCHGSRFDPDGQVLHGPAVQPLEPVEQ